MDIKIAIEIERLKLNKTIQKKCILTAPTIIDQSKKVDQLIESYIAKQLNHKN